MNNDLRHHLNAFSRIIYYVTEEEDRFLSDLATSLAKHVDHIQVFNSSFGLVPLTQLIRDWRTREHKANPSCMDMNAALEAIYKEDPKEHQKYYVITDPERWLGDAHMQRRLLNVIHQVHNDLLQMKCIIFVGSTKVIPPKLSRYIQVVEDTGLTQDEIAATVGAVCEATKMAVPENTADMFAGLTDFEVQAALSQSLVRTRKTPEGRRVDPAFISEFRRGQFKKTDLVQLINTDACTFDQVGGGERFKEWAEATKCVWTEGGRKAGLDHPKGVLAVGVWGTGKSLLTKTLATTWGVSLVQLEMGRLRSPHVGQSEANVYRALKIIESAAPCVIHIDEAEKSLSGGQSSGASDAGTTSRTIGILSTWMQETKAPICVAMTANSLSTLPVEFVNRMDERFFFSLPSQRDRVAIIKIHMQKRGQDPSQYNLADLAAKAKELVGREIEQCIVAACIQSYNKGSVVNNKVVVLENILAEVLTKKSRIVRTMADEIKEVTDWVGWDEDNNDGIRAKFASEPEKKKKTSAMKIVD